MTRFFSDLCLVEGPDGELVRSPRSCRSRSQWSPVRRERPGHGRGRVHRVASRRGAARARRATSSASIRSRTTTTLPEARERRGPRRRRRLDLVDGTSTVGRRVDGVFHLAGQPGVRASFGHVFEHLRRAATSSRPSALFEAAAAARCAGVVRVVLLDLRRRRALPHPRGRHAAPDLAVRRHEAVRRAPR